MTDPCHNEFPEVPRDAIVELIDSERGSGQMHDIVEHHLGGKADAQAVQNEIDRLRDEVERLRAERAEWLSTVAHAVRATPGLEHVVVGFDRDLLRRALLDLRPRRGQGKLPRRSVVGAALGHGAGVSAAICRALGIDPDGGA